MDATHGPTGLDDVDRRILALLCDDARKSVRALARAVGMSPGAVEERVERMERAGMITGYRAELNPSMLGYALEVLVGVELTQHKSVA
ncbi:Lrp/AsnC family transcriptional regulator [Rhodococcus sp. NPDC004095]